jgi:hypothetical protein
VVAVCRDYSIVAVKASDGISNDDYTELVEVVVVRVDDLLTGNFPEEAADHWVIRQRRIHQIVI